MGHISFYQTMGCKREDVTADGLRVQKVFKMAGFVFHDCQHMRADPMGGTLSGGCR
jgi:hypothetical protein